MKEKTKKQINITSSGEVVIYQAEDKENLEVKIQEDTVWLSQKKMAGLFDKDTKTINEHIRNVYKEGELSKDPTIRKFQIVQMEGNRRVERQIDFYNLDVIISVGYRIKSHRGTQFRIWATRVLRDHIMKGFTINERRLKEKEQTKLGELQRAIRLLKSATQNKKVSKSEALGLLQVITDYTNSWVILHDYDEGKIETKKSRKASFVFNYNEAKESISELKKKLLAKKKASDIFGIEREEGLKSILGNISQSFGGKDLYGSIEEKAAHLLYFVIKDHPFVDGNKRIAAFLFVLFLNRNNFLFDKDGERRINNNTLVAIALLVAESDPKEKEVMVKIITNMISSK